MSEISFEKAIEIALEQHQAGNFARAEALYVEILRQDPGNIDAMHLLGVLAHQGKRPELAVDLISAAIRKRGDLAPFHYNLAEALHAMSRADEAINGYQRAIELDPQYFEAHNNLANILNETRRHTESESWCRKAVALRPEDAAPHNNLGNALRGQGREAEALAAYEKAIELRPDFVEAMTNRALCLCAMGKLTEGIAQFRIVIHTNPTHADVHNNLGTALVHLGQLEDAGACFQTAIDLKPDHAEALNNLGSVLRGLGKIDDSAKFFQKAIDAKPDFFVAQSNLAIVLSDLGRKADALEKIDAAIKLRSDRSIDHMIRGTILRDMHRMDEAIESVRESLRLDPKNTSALTCLGYTLLERGDLEEAMASLRHSIELKPDPQTHSNVLMTVNYHPGYSPADLLVAHKSWAELHEKPHIPGWRPHANNRSPERRLRIGYVSPDFRGHSVSYFLEPILEHHDHSQFEIFAYAHMISVDMQTWKLRATIDQWREISTLRADELAEKIRADEIDILIELAGHTANNALTTFARKPAPVQMNMIGFPSTTGLSAIDYRITDDRCDPPGVSDPFNTEKLLRLPEIFWCYRPPSKSPEVGPLPSATSGQLTFTSVNNFTKVTPDIQRMWAKLLRAVPNSRLILQTAALGSNFTREKIKAIFAEEGVSADRLDFRIWSDFQEYLKLLNESDMTLDPYPFNGGTTTCHSLWMGAPVITLAGDRHASRMGLSMLTCIGLPEFIAHSADEYVEIGRRFAGDLPRLAEIRAGMRERLKASPLLDGLRYTQNLEAAYRNAWRSWCETAPKALK